MEGSLQWLWLDVVRKYYSYNFLNLKHYNIHPGQIMLISLINSRPGLTQGEITKILHIKASTLTVSIKRLEKAGYARRESDKADKRMMHVYLTEEGSIIAQDVINGWNRNEKMLFENFSNSDQLCFEKCLKIMDANIENNIKNYDADQCCKDFCKMSLNDNINYEKEE